MLYWGHEEGERLMTDVYHPGLEGVVAAETRVSFLDLEAEEIVIRGYDLLELASHKRYLEVVHLLWEGRLPTPDDLGRFAERLRAVPPIGPEMIDLLRLVARTGHPMHVLRTAVSAMGTWDASGDVETQLDRLLVQVPQVIAAAEQIRQNRPRVLPDRDAPFSANVLRMMTGKEPSELEADIFDKLLILYSEHEMPNSTFAARVIASTRADVYGALSGAVASLSGPLHGGANEAVMHMLEAAGRADRMEPFLLEALAKKERIMGFGHRVYMHRPDPRAVMMKHLLEQLVAVKGHEDLLDRCRIGEAVMAREKGLFPNLDYYAAPVYHLLGVPTPLFTPIFFAARIAGLGAHLREQYQANRLFRPRVRYLGPRGMKLGEGAGGR